MMMKKIAMIELCTQKKVEIQPYQYELFEAFDFNQPQIKKKSFKRIRSKNKTKPIRKFNKTAWDNVQSSPLEDIEKFMRKIT